MRLRRSLIVFVVVVLLGTAGSSLWIRARQRQNTLDRQLITALMKDDTKQALALINAGVDPNTHFNPPPAPSFKLLLDQFWHHQPPPTDDSPTAFLLACGADCKQRAEGCAGPTNHSDNVAIVQAMYRHGANLNAESTGNHCALHWAADANRMRVAEWLLAHGANINAEDWRGTTPLMWAASSAHPNIVRLLLAHGAAVSVEEDRGLTALHFAVIFRQADLYEKDRDTIRQLLAQGADPNQPDRQGKSALRYAQDEKRLDLVALLKRGGK